MRDRYDQGLFLSADKQIKPPVSKLRSPQSSLLGGRAFPKFAFLRELTGNCVSFHGQNYLAGASVAAMTAYFHRGARCALARRTVTVSAVAVLFLGLTSIGAQYTRSEFVRGHFSAEVSQDHTHVRGSATSGELFTMDESLRRSSLIDKNSVLRGTGGSCAQNLRSWLAKKEPEIHQERCHLVGVVTTIFEPSEAVQRFLSLDQVGVGLCLVVVGDKKGPNEYEFRTATDQVLKNPAAFISAEEQMELEKMCLFIEHIPWNHFGRKNVGYLLAVIAGAQLVFDFDDDNIIEDHRGFEAIINQLSIGPSQSAPLAAFTVEEPPEGTGHGVWNPYPFLGSPPETWPRGFPLEHIKNSFRDQQLDECALEPESVGVVQLLANGSPDVDAVYRLTKRLSDFNFSWTPDHPLLFAPHGSYAPWNAQATIFSRQALWGLLLPTSVHGRVSDIWRSFIVTYLFNGIGLHVTFSKALVFQDRNPHNYLSDFNSEIPLYQRSGALVEFLRRSELSSETLPERFIELWDLLYQYNIIEAEDIVLAQLWMETLKEANLEFPLQKKIPKSSSKRENVKRVDQHTFKSLEQFRYAYDRDIKETGVCNSTENILFVSKTGGNFKERVYAQKRTWVRYAKHVVFFSDMEDNELPAIVTVNDAQQAWYGQQPLKNRPGALASCLTLLHGLKLIVHDEPQTFDWIAIGDDDLFWQPNRLAKALSNEDHSFPLMFRTSKPSTVSFETQYHANQSISHEFLAGSTAAGLVLNRGLIQLMRSSLSWEDIAIQHYCEMGHHGDDTTVNYLSIFLGVEPIPMEGLTYEHPQEVSPYGEQITWHARLGGDYQNEYPLDAFDKYSPSYFGSSDEICRGNYI